MIDEERLYERKERTRMPVEDLIDQMRTHDSL